MTGVTVDHLIATTIFLAAILVFTGLFTQTLQAAILYQQNRHISLKATDLLDNILLSSGYPYNWGETNDTLSCFGLRRPGTVGYELSSFALMRLTPLYGEPVEYPRDSGEWYNNVSVGPNGYLFIPISDSVTYETATRLLGVNGTYGFQLSITPLVNVSITEHQPDPLILEVQVNGPGFSLGGANLNYYLFRVDKACSLELTIGTTTTDHTGRAYLNFTFDGEAETYALIIYASLSGLHGLGHYNHRYFTQGAGVIPFVVNYEKGKVYLAHSWDVHDQGTPVPNYEFNASFFMLTDDVFERWPLANSTGGLNYGSKNYEITTLPVAHPGFLLVTYRSGNEIGISLMPWGIGTLAVSTSFGGNPAGNVWTATDVRQAVVDKLSYQIRITCWSLEGYSVFNPAGWR